MSHSNGKPPDRQRVLIVSRADGHLEVFGERNVDVHLARAPAAFSVEGEHQAEQLAEWMLPRRYRDLFRADRLRKTGTTRPLLPSTLADSLVVAELLKTLNSIGEQAA